MSRLNLNVSLMPPELAAQNLPTHPVQYWWVALFSEPLSMLADPSDMNSLRYLPLPRQTNHLTGGISAARRSSSLALPPQEPADFPQESRFSFPAVYLPIYGNSMLFSHEDKGAAACHSLLHHLNSRLDWNQTREQRLAILRRYGCVILEFQEGGATDPLTQFQPTTKFRSPLRPKRHTKGPRDFSPRLDDRTYITPLPSTGRIQYGTAVEYPEPILTQSELRAAGFSEEEVRQYFGTPSLMEELTDPLPPEPLLPGMVPHQSISDPKFNVPQSCKHS